jgi:hypothetical protein
MAISRALATRWLWAMGVAYDVVVVVAVVAVGVW